jgi:hypothetical protein
MKSELVIVMMVLVLGCVNGRGQDIIINEGISMGVIGNARLPDGNIDNIDDIFGNPNDNRVLLGSFCTCLGDVYGAVSGIGGEASSNEVIIRGEVRSPNPDNFLAVNKIYGAYIRGWGGV